MKTYKKKDYISVGKPMSKGEFIKFVKNSEESGEMDFDKGLEIIEVRLAKRRKVKL